MKPSRRKPDRGAAVALSYRTGMHAPTVVAKGYGALAERIVDKAKGAGVFVHDSPELVQLLMQVDLDDHIPAELYLAVAEVLAFIHHLEQQAGATDGAPGPRSAM
ncbi:MAG: EscU/YscU/HrcU family type III secretion system export apparatus switch protein [Rhizobacter sp.]|nr:EscU/YscU/HrcU family type III secretion system export apparatus switch protein [Rhizobacter sp.]